METIDPNVDVMWNLCILDEWEEAEKWLLRGKQQHSNQQQEDEMIKKALEYTDDNDFGTTALHYACHNGAPVSLVRLMIESAPRTVNVANKCGNLPLHYAVKGGVASVEVLRLLLHHTTTTTTLTTKCLFGRTPLSRALYHGNYRHDAKVIGLLAGHGAVAVADQDGLLPSHHAREKGYSAGIQLQIVSEFTKKINAKGQTPLLWAVDEGHLNEHPAVVETLGANGAAAIVDKKGNYPLHVCCMRIQ